MPVLLQPESQIAAHPSAAPGGRLASLDILRGLTVATMILVNNNGSSAHTWAILEHAPWNGFTLADFVFPAFLLMVGVSIQLSLGSRVAKGVPPGTLLLPILRRAALIFTFGVLIGGFPFYHLHTLRLYGVLQRIALCFLASSLLTLYTRTRTLVAVSVALLAGYWALLRFTPVPGLGVPVRDVPFLDPFANIVSWTDRALFSAPHLYHHGVYDPCGLLGTLPSIVSTLIGVLAGKWIATDRTPLSKLKGIAAGAAGCIALGLLWSPWFPINKRLWTSSYVLLAAGLALALFALCFALFDLRGWRKNRAWPALVFGTNALAAYILSELLAAALGAIHLTVGGHVSSLRALLYQPFQSMIPNPELGSFLYALTFVGICFIPMWLLYRRRIFIKV